MYKWSSSELWKCARIFFSSEDRRHCCRYPGCWDSSCFIDLSFRTRVDTGRKYWLNLCIDFLCQGTIWTMGCWQGWDGVYPTGWNSCALPGWVHSHHPPTTGIEQNHSWEPQGAVGWWWPGEAVMVRPFLGALGSQAVGQGSQLVAHLARHRYGYNTAAS